MFRQKIQAKLINKLDHCQEHKYTCINDKTIYLIIQLQIVVTQKQHNCGAETVHVFGNMLAKTNIS